MAESAYLAQFLLSAVVDFERHEAEARESNIVIGRCESLGTFEDVTTDFLKETVVMNSNLLARFMMSSEDKYLGLFPSVLKDATFEETSRATKKMNVGGVDVDVATVVVKGSLRSLCPAIPQKAFHVTRIVRDITGNGDAWEIVDVEMGEEHELLLFSGFLVKRISDAESEVTCIIQRSTALQAKAGDDDYQGLFSKVYGPERWLYALKREAERRSVLGFELKLNGNLELLHKGDEMKSRFFELLSVGPCETAAHSRCLGNTFAAMLSVKLDASYTDVFRGCRNSIVARSNIQSKLPSPLSTNVVSSCVTESGAKMLFEAYTDPLESMVVATLPGPGQPLRGFTIYSHPPLTFLTSAIVECLGEDVHYTDWKVEAEAKVGTMLADVVDYLNNH